MRARGVLPRECGDEFKGCRGWGWRGEIDDLLFNGGKFWRWQGQSKMDRCQSLPSCSPFKSWSWHCPSAIVTQAARSCCGCRSRVREQQQQQLAAAACPWGGSSHRPRCLRFRRAA